MSIVSRIVGVSVTAVSAAVLAVVLYDDARETRSAHEAQMRLETGDGRAGATPDRFGPVADAEPAPSAAIPEIDTDWARAGSGDGAFTDAALAALDETEAGFDAAGGVLEDDALAAIDEIPPIDALLGDQLAAQDQLAVQGQLAVQDQLAVQEPTGGDLATADPAASGEDTAYLAFVERQRAADRLGVGESLRRNYPASEDILMRALHAAAEAGANQRELDRRRTQFVAALLAEKIGYTPYASLAALREYISYNLTLADLARQNFGAAACAEAVTRGGAAFSARLRSAPAAVVEDVVQALADQTGAILDAARQGETAGLRELEPPDSAAWRELHRAMERLGATRTQISLLMAGGGGAPDDLCAATQTFYAALLSIDAEQASKLLPFVTRTMVGGAGQ